MARYFTAEELETLRALRATFLLFEDRAGRSPGPGYWEALEDLELYDATFAQRIGWKWEAVLDELVRRGRLPAGAVVLDWGCGTGIAARRYLTRATGGVERLHLWDRSEVARGFAAELVEEEHPALRVVEGLPPEAPDVLLVSHVLDELAEEDLQGLLDLAARAGAVIWVEPGSRLTARRLGEVRARLAAELDVLAPCTHQASCGLQGRASDWCHFFARPPQAVFVEGQWAEFSRELGIDLRSLPYSFLALARRGAFELGGPSARLIARPRLTRGRAELEVCDASGVRALNYLQRTDKALFKELGDTAGEPWLFDAAVEGQRIVALERRER